MQFYQLAIGARFLFRGRTYEKTAMATASDDQGCHYTLLAETEVIPEGEPLLLPPEEAARWKPSDKHWTEHLSPAPTPPPRPDQPQKGTSYPRR